jgi:hypothetical protein
MTRALALLIAALLLIAGCGEDEGGGDGSSGSEDPMAALDKAATATESVESFKQEYEMESDIGGQNMSMTGEGTLNADSTNGRMSFDLETPEGSGKFEAVVVDGVMFLKGDQIQLPGGKEWIQSPDAPSGTLSPSEFVTFLRDSGKVKNEGTEEIRGQQTTHYRGPVDIKQLMENSNNTTLQRLRQAPDVQNMDLTVDVWVADDGLPARIAIDMVPPPSQAKGSMKMSADVLEYDVPVEVEAPPASKVLKP